MSDARLLQRLDEVVVRMRRLRAVKASLACWTVLGIVLLGMLIDGQPRIELLKAIVICIPLSIVSSLIVGRRRTTDRSEAALLLENEFPELDLMLLAAMRQSPDLGRWELSYLQSEVISDVLKHERKHDWSSAVKSFTLTRVSRIAAMLTCLLLVLKAPTLTSIHESAPVVDQAVEEVPVDPRLPIEISVDPGDAEVERGTSLLVLARFGERLPNDVTLVATDQNANEVRIPLQKSLDDPIFGGRIPEIVRDLTYRVEYDQENSDDFSVTMFTYPELVKADAEIQFPEYTGLEAERLENIRRLSVVEGANIDFDFELNKDVKSAAFVDDDGNRLELESGQTEVNRRALSWVSSKPGKKKFRLELTDQNDRSNRDAPEFVIQVLPNKPANLKVAFPARDVRVSPLEELSLQANASDDFGLIEYGLVYETPDGKQAEMVLGEKAGKDEKTSMDHLLHLEKLNVTPDQLLSYYFYADDIGPDGKQRRAYSDIFFSEVRPFEEIFREVPANQQQQQQQQQQEGTQSGKLLEVQRQIVTATWNLIRSESRAQPSPKFEESTQVLFESQEQAIILAEELMEKIDDEQMKVHLTEAMELMGSASRHFAGALKDEDIEFLHDARAKAQEAYQALLKLNSREKKVQQSQQSQSQSQQSRQQDRNRQLKALELKNNRDRYETERQAQQQQQQQEQRETLQVLNRLRELARRQEDLNEKIRELENKLREETDDDEKEKLQRELKRLQEEQEELLRNLDELKERMSTEENRERMAEAREQVDQTRERVRRAAEALKDQQTSKALTEGTRAQRELDELKEEFKNQTASQFADAVRELRDDARELSANQEEIAQAMNGDEKEQEQPKRKTLRPTDETKDREEIAKALEAQKGRLSDLLDRTKELVEESENTEPLLSSKLYETMRDLRKYEPEEALEGAAQLQRYGIEEEAKKAQAQAQQGINQLQRGVEEAAESILGDEGETLAAASEVLDELTRAIENELRANGSRPPITDEKQQGEENSQQPQPGHQSGKSPSEQNQQNLKNGTGQPSESENEMQPGQQKSDSPTNPNQQAEQKQSEQNSPQPGQSPGKNDQATDGKSPRQSPMPGQGEHPSSEGQPRPDSKSQQSSGFPQQGGKPSDTGKQGEQTGQQRQNETSQKQQGQPSGQRQGQNNGQQAEQGDRQGSQRGQNRPNIGQQLGNLFQESAAEGGGAFGPRRPLTGEDYKEWSDQMRDLEEMVTSPEMRSQVATIRERARQMRIDMKRHSKAPDWELVRTSVYGPLVELQQEIAEEIARRDPNEKLVPIDRDPVPEKYADLLQRYYEELAKQRQAENSAPSQTNEE